MNSDTPATRSFSSFAIASLVLGIVSILGGGLLLVPPLLAVIFGHIAVGACNRDANMDGKGVAIAGLILGYITLIGVAIIFFGWIALFSTLSNASY